MTQKHVTRVVLQVHREPDVTAYLFGHDTGSVEEKFIGALITTLMEWELLELKLKADCETVFGHDKKGQVVG